MTIKSSGSLSITNLKAEFPANVRSQMPNGGNSFSDYQNLVLFEPGARERVISASPAMSEFYNRSWNYEVDIVLIGGGGGGGGVQSTGAAVMAAGGGGGGAVRTFTNIPIVPGTNYALVCGGSGGGGGSTGNRGGRGGTTTFTYNGITRQSGGGAGGGGHNQINGGDGIISSSGGGGCGTSSFGSGGLGNSGAGRGGSSLYASAKSREGGGGGGSGGNGGNGQFGADTQGTGGAGVSLNSFVGTLPGDVTIPAAYFSNHTGGYRLTNTVGGGGGGAYGVTGSSIEPAGSGGGGSGRSHNVPNDNNRDGSYGSGGGGGGGVKFDGVLQGAGAGGGGSVIVIYKGSNRRDSTATSTNKIVRTDVNNGNRCVVIFRRNATSTNDFSSSYDTSNTIVRA